MSATILAVIFKERLPGADCGACGKPGCFAYAQAVAKDVAILDDSPCRILASDKDATQELGEYLGLDLSNTGPGSKAVVHCTGDSPQIGSYNGVQTRSDLCIGSSDWRRRERMPLCLPRVWRLC